MRSAAGARRSKPGVKDRCTTSGARRSGRSRSCRWSRDARRPRPAARSRGSSSRCRAASGARRSCRRSRAAGARRRTPATSRACQSSSIACGASLNGIQPVLSMPRSSIRTLAIIRYCVFTRRTISMMTFLRSGVRANACRITTRCVSSPGDEAVRVEREAHAVARLGVGRLVLHEHPAAVVDHRLQARARRPSRPRPTVARSPPPVVTALQASRLVPSKPSLKMSSGIWATSPMVRPSW